jgi:hypothetical protein
MAKYLRKDVPMSQEELDKQFALASALVKTWPEWKQKILEISLSPTVPVPREPVDNFCEDPHTSKTRIEISGLFLVAAEIEAETPITVGATNNKIFWVPVPAANATEPMMFEAAYQDEDGIWAKEVFEKILEADKDIRAGRIIKCKDAEEMIAKLKGLENDKTPMDKATETDLSQGGLGVND